MVEAILSIATFMAGVLFYKYIRKRPKESELLEEISGLEGRIKQLGHEYTLAINEINILRDTIARIGALASNEVARKKRIERPWKIECLDE